MVLTARVRKGLLSRILHEKELALQARVCLERPVDRISYLQNMAPEDGEHDNTSHSSDHEAKSNGEEGILRKHIDEEQGIRHNSNEGVVHVNIPKLVLLQQTSS